MKEVLGPTGSCTKTFWIFHGNRYPAFGASITVSRATILKHTGMQFISESLKLSLDLAATSLSNVLQYSVTLLTTFNGWGRALSDCHRQALFLVATILKHTL